MKTMGKRLIAVLCCVVLLVTSMYISKPQKAEAAESGTMSLVCGEYTYVGYLNIDYTLSGVTYSGIGARFLDNAFYITTT